MEIVTSWVSESRFMLLDELSERFGPLSEDLTARINAITSLPDLGACTPCKDCEIVEGARIVVFAMRGPGCGGPIVKVG